MKYLTPVNNSNRFRIEHTDNTGQNTNYENFNLALTIQDVTGSSDTAIALDTFAKSFVALSTDTYSDSKIYTTKNLDSIAGGA